MTMTADDYIKDVLSAMPAATPRRAQIAAELRGNLRAARRGRGHRVQHVPDVVVSSHRHVGSPSERSRSVMAFANVVHSRVNRASSARPASVRS